MPVPTDPLIHNFLVILSFLCLGFWVITYKVQPANGRFELFAVDFAVGTFLFSALAATLLGSYGTDLSFGDRLVVSSKTAQAFMWTAGALFGVGNTLLLGGVSLLGISGAYGIAGGIGLAVVFALRYPGSNASSLVAALLLTAGALLAIVAGRASDPVRASTKGKAPAPIQLRRSTKGALVSVLGGVAVALSYPLAMRGAFDEFGLGPYAGLFFFCSGVLVANVIFSLYFFNIALEGGALSLQSYFRGWPGKHWLGIVGGMLWGAGALPVLLLHPPSTATVRLQATSTLPVAAIPLAMLLGIAIWKEFLKAPKGAVALILASAFLIAGGCAILFF